MKKWLIFNPSPPLCLTGSQGACWTEWWFSWRVLPACFWLGGETDHSVHAWIHYFCCCLLSLAKLRHAFGTCTLLPFWLPCSYCHRHTIKSVWMLVERGLTRIGALLYLQRIADVSQWVCGREVYMMKRLQNNTLWLRFSTTLKLCFYDPQHYGSSKHWSCIFCHVVHSVILWSLR